MAGADRVPLPKLFEPMVVLPALSAGRGRGKSFRPADSSVGGDFPFVCVAARGPCARTCSRLVLVRAQALVWASAVDLELVLVWELARLGVLVLVWVWAGVLALV